ncbi:hypothetical protein N7516_005320 [Penicillium verrucosum]|uniref:uncharacterized protein n=1 Tax=Penicillium verrucosum TaxID=60171 RepID=UPI0025450761|nr:uncharacterized protein N7516_005320 [Penicillium verrucosum]KAJ5945152.1 hypothetical protein N7516_005320 [Penicillium verrucosum]
MVAGVDICYECEESYPQLPRFTITATAFKSARKCVALSFILERDLFDQSSVGTAIYLLIQSIFINEKFSELPDVCLRGGCPITIVVPPVLRQKPSSQDVFTDEIAAHEINKK